MGERKGFTLIELLVVMTMRPYYSHEPQIRNCPLVHKFYSDGVTGPFVGWGVYGEGSYSTPGWAVAGDYGSYGWNCGNCGGIAAGPPTDARRARLYGPIG